MINTYFFRPMFFLELLSKVHDFMKELNILAKFYLLALLTHLNFQFDNFLCVFEYAVYMFFMNKTSS